MAVCFLFLAPAHAADGKLSLDLYLDLEEVQDRRISPDGTQIVFTGSSSGSTIVAIATVFWKMAIGISLSFLPAAELRAS